MENKAKDKEDNVFSDAESAALKYFLNTFIAAIKSASMYFSGHPSTIKLAKNSAEALSRLSTFWKEITIGATTEGLFLNGAYFQKGSVLYKDTAIYLHHRYIGSMKIKIDTDLDTIIKLINVLAMKPEELLRIGGASKAFSDEGGPGIEIKQLDYSVLLDTQGESGDSTKAYTEEDIWRFLIENIVVGGDCQYSPKMEEATSLLNNLKNLRQLLNSARDADKASIISKSLKEVEKYLERNHPENNQPFVKNLIRGILDTSEEPRENLTKGGLADSLKEFTIKHLKEGDLVDIIISHIEEKKAVDGLLLNFLNLLASGTKMQTDLPDALADGINQKGLVGELPSFRKSVQQLFASRPNDKFISVIYRKNLNFFLDGKPEQYLESLGQYREDIEEESVASRYYNILLALLEGTPELEEYKRISEMLVDSIPVLLKKGSFSFIRQMFVALQNISQKESSLELQALAKEIFDRAINSSLIKEIWSNLLSYAEPEFKDAISLLTMFGGDCPERALGMFLDKNDPDAQSKLNYLLSQCKNRVVVAFWPLLNKNLSLERRLEIVRILGSIHTEDSQKILIALFGKGDEMLSLEALRALRNFPSVDINFLFMAVCHGDYFIRKEAIDILMSKGDPEIGRRLAAALFVPGGSFATNYNLLMQNIELAGELRLEGVIPALAAILKRKGFFFRKRLNVLRFMAAKSLISIGSPEAIKIVTGFKSDSHRQLREYVQKAESLYGRSEGPDKTALENKSR